MIEEGTILQERYRIGKRIGEGGMGAVYLATDERFGSRVAIKETLFTDDHYKKAFKREARLLNSLKHPALPKVSDHFIEDNGQYIVMEYIAGDDLFDTLEKTNQPFPIVDVENWSEQLLDALEYLHSQENPVIHRDIKPQNLKMTPDGQVILLDFGLAKGNPTDANHKTAAQSIFGYSRNYASLEQIQGTGTDPRSDIYSLAATLYHLVTGKPPADALTRVMMVLNEEPDPLIPAADAHEQVTESLSNVLYQAMSLNAKLRPQSTSEMQDMLQGKIAVEPRERSDTVANKHVNTGLLARETQILPNKTGVHGKRSELKTEILPGGNTGDDSVRTRLAQPRTAVSTGKNTDESGVRTGASRWSQGYAIAAVLAAFLLIGSVIGASYFFDSSSSGDEASVDNSDGSGNANIVDQPINTDADIANGNSQTGEGEITETVEPGSIPGDLSTEIKSADAEKPKTVAKKSDGSSAPTASGKNSAQEKPEVDEGEIVIKDGNIVTKDVMITNGRIVTPGVVIDGDKVIINGEVVNRSQVANPKTKEEFKRLSPKEQKRVLMLREIRRIERLKRQRRRPPPLPRSPSNRPD